MSRNGVSRSCLDHCYSDAPEKLSQVCVELIGESDHLGIMVTKLSKNAVHKPQTLRKRVYKNFDIHSFLTDIYESDINQSVTNEPDLENAARLFGQKFADILESHAPIKTLYVRKNYRPDISLETKYLIKEKQIYKKKLPEQGMQFC